jgi:hypothetical protein
MGLLLAEMMERYVAMGDASAAPDRLSFIFYLSALQRCSPEMLIDRTERAQRVLDWIHQVGLGSDDDLLRRVQRCTN